MQAKQKYGYQLYGWYGTDILDQSKIILRMQICRLDPYENHCRCFAAVDMLHLEFTLLQLDKGQKLSRPYGLEAAALPESLFEGNRNVTEMIPQHDWLWTDRVYCQIHDATEVGVARAMELVSKALDVATYASVDYLKPPFAAVIVCWSNLDRFARVCVALQALGVMRISGNLQNYQVYDNTQLDGAQIARLYRDSELLRNEQAAHA